MTTTKYKFSNGHEEDVEVNDEVAAALAEFEKQDKSDRRTARRHNELSVEEMIESGREPIGHRSIETDYEELEEKEELLAAVSELPEKHQRIVQLYYYEGKTLKETAEILGISFQAVSQQLVTIHETLKKYLDNF